MALTLRERLRGSYCLRCDDRAAYLVSAAQHLLAATCSIHLDDVRDHWIGQFGAADVEPLADLDDEWRTSPGSG